MLLIGTRSILFIIILVLSYNVMRKSRIERKKLIYVLSLIFSVLLTTLLTMFPIERLFIKFNSPESVFKYACIGEIDEIIYGQESCLIIYTRSNNTSSHYIIPKEDGNYIIPTYFQTKKVMHRFDSEALFDVYNIKGTEEHYVFGVVHLNEGMNEVSVFNGSGEEQEGKVFHVKDSNFIYFYIGEEIKGYYLMVNGQKILLNK